MGDQVLALHVAQSILELHQLNEDVVLRVEAGRRHRALEVERQPLLNALHTGALGKIHKQDQVEHQRSGKNGIAAKEIDLDLHRIVHPAEDIDVIPTLFGIAARRVVVNTNSVIEIFVEAGVEIRLQNLFEHRKL